MCTCNKRGRSLSLKLRLADLPSGFPGLYIFHTFTVLSALQDTDIGSNVYVQSCNKTESERRDKVQLTNLVSLQMHQSQ